MDRGAWWAIVPGVAKSLARLGEKQQESRLSSIWTLLDLGQHHMKADQLGSETE